MKKYFLSMKISTIIAALACVAIAFLLWLYFNIHYGGL